MFEFVGNDSPVGRGNDTHAVAGPYIRLVKYWKYMVAVVRLQVGVQVLLAVAFVNKRVQSVAVIAIIVDKINFNPVVTKD